MELLPAKPLSGARILIVDDVPANLSVLTRTLEPEGCEVLAASTGSAALKVAAKAQPDLILLDIMMPEMDGLETCRRLKVNSLTAVIPVVFITARQEMESIVQAFGVGGVDYIIKPFQAEEVLSRVATHVRLSQLTRQLIEKNLALEIRTEELTAEINRRRQAESALQMADEKLATFSNLEAARGNLAGMVGTSAPIRKITEEVKRLHRFPKTSVLVTGESGTGKELVARAIHFGSERARAPFVPINCVAIPAELAESVLFGHVKGAFTGAHADRKGSFELADGGTLFLDELGDMPAEIQVKLLRVLEESCVTPVGASESRPVDVRVIAATNADLDLRIADGRFRHDLYFRLARYTLSTPNLRDRLEDLPLLVEHFLRQFALEMGQRPPGCSKSAMAVLRGYDFPGNVRELRNIIERALIESGGETVQPEHLRLGGPSSTAVVKMDSRDVKEDMAETLPLNLADAEEMLIRRALSETGGNIAEASRLLGVHRTRIYRKMAR